jgi:tRNA pseudouridine65 synthase
MSFSPLEIIYQDEFLVAINKPSGLIVHKTPMAKDAKVFALQELRNQLDQYVYPAHRIDRQTSGVLLFALSPEVDKQLKELFREQKVKKTYWTIVRGFTPEEGTITKPLAKEGSEEVQQATTHYKKLKQIELPIPVSKYPACRLSFLEVYPETGRMHQIRKHLAHIRHYIIADKPHGDCKQNKMFFEKFGLNNMLLHSRGMIFEHPITKKTIELQAELPTHFQEILNMFQE